MTLRQLTETARIVAEMVSRIDCAALDARTFDVPIPEDAEVREHLVVILRRRYAPPEWAVDAGAGELGHFVRVSRD